MSKRSYKQNCALATALDTVGERWTLLIVRELLIKPKRYGELLNNLVGMGTNLLAARLRDMQRAELIRKTSIGGTPAYALTEKGQTLESVVNSLVVWGLDNASPAPTGSLTRREWDSVALKAIIKASPIRLEPGVYEVILNDVAFTVDVESDRLNVLMARPEKADTFLALDGNVAQQLSRGEMSVQQALEAGHVSFGKHKTRARTLLKALVDYSA